MGPTPALVRIGLIGFGGSGRIRTVGQSVLRTCLWLTARVVSGA